MADTAPIRSEDQAAETPEQLAALWGKELSAAREAQKTWWERSEKIVKRYLDDRGEKRVNTTRLNLFSSNTQTMESLLFGKTPEVGVQRRFADSSDDEARVASETLERILNTDIEDEDGEQQEALRNALRDRLIVGLGNVRVRYEIGDTEMQPEQPAQMHPDTGQELAPAVPEQEMRPNEKACVDYIYWKDQLWSPCRTFDQLRWWAFASEMSEKQFNERFPDAQDAWTANRKNPSSATDPVKVKDPLDRCIVWEIWSKERETVDWLVIGYDKILDSKQDPLGLDGFWPFPRPMFANLTTSKMVPTPDFVMAEDLYEQIDTLQSRIWMLEDVIGVRGVYDKNSEEIKRLINQTGKNELIGVDSWSAFAEKGGIKGVVDWLPIDMIAECLDKLNAQQTIKIGLLYQITGMSDIMRGQASEQSTATEQAIKARFASVRVQTLQDEFARFASDTQKLRAEIISKHFDPQTIINRSNVMRTPDAALAQAAVALIKQPDFGFRISVNPDSISLQDFAALKQERFEFANSIGPFFQSMFPFIQLAGSVPGGAQAATKFTISLAQTMIAGLKGANEMEGIFDEFVAELTQAAQQAAQNPPPPPPPDPKVIAAQVKGQAEQFKAKADVMKTGLDLHVAQQKHQMDMQKAGMDMKKMQIQASTGIQSAEAKARAQGLEALNKVTGDGPT